MEDGILGLFVRVLRVEWEREKGWELEETKGWRCMLEWEDGMDKEERNCEYGGVHLLCFDGVALLGVNYLLCFALLYLLN